MQPPVDQVDLTADQIESPTQLELPRSIVPQLLLSACGCTGISICKKATNRDKLEMKRLEDMYEDKKAESKAKEVGLPCESGVGFKKRKVISEPLQRAFGVEIRTNWIKK
ncbi:hypothetical protein E3N88_29645 [Mikania micrantha]|uniref:Uncharacterized protein n=1 Tax=Mikania micrantha TaxID=192012 RepID=A0A5N6MK51_9ASTR|nr:hypothetical protein E3N88_29645 [Mikania micrantha]